MIAVYINGSWSVNSSLILCLILFVAFIHKMKGSQVWRNSSQFWRNTAAVLLFAPQSSGVIKRLKTAGDFCAFDFLLFFFFFCLVKTFTKPQRKKNLIKHDMMEYANSKTVCLSLHYVCSLITLSVLQEMSLAILSGWISPEKVTIRVTTTPGGSLTWWIRITSATVSSTLLTGTWTARRTSTAGWQPHL